MTRGLRNAIMILSVVLAFVLIAIDENLHPGDYAGVRFRFPGVWAPALSLLVGFLVWSGASKDEEP
jgi:hypothetical protein